MTVKWKARALSWSLSMRLFSWIFFFTLRCYLLAGHAGEERLRASRERLRVRLLFAGSIVRLKVKFELRKLKNEETVSISFFPIPISACPLVFTALHQTVFDYRLIYDTARFGQYIFVVTSNFSCTSVIALPKHSSNSRLIFSFCRILFWWYRRKVIPMNALNS